MTANQSIVVAWSYGLAGAVYLALALRLFLGPKRTARTLALGVAAAFTAIWGLAMAAYALWRVPTLDTLSGVGEVLAYGGWYAFLLLLGGSAVGSTTRARQTWLLPVSIAVVAWGVVAQLLASLPVQLPLDATRVLLVDSLAAAVLGLVLVEQLFRNTTEESRWSITPLCVAVAAVCAFDIYTFADAVLFNRIDIDVWSVRGVVRVLALPLIALSLVRSRGGAFAIVVSRRVMFRSTALAMTGLYLLFMAAVGYYIRYFGGEWGRALQITLLFAAVLLLVVLVFSGSVRAKLRVSVSKHFFRYRYDYREEWLRFTQTLSIEGEHRAMGQQVIKGLANMVESPGGSLWLRDASAARFVPTAQWNFPTGEPEDANGELVKFLATSGWVVNLEEFRYAPARYGELRLPPWLSAIGSAWLVVPLAIGNELIGFVVLGTARTVVEVNWEINDLLKTAGRQAATFLGHVQATEALLEARKFEAFNRLSAFVVHDLKNIVAQLSLMLRNAERHRDNPEFQEDMLMTVEHSVDRMKQLMLQLRDGTTPLDMAQRVELAELAGRVLRGKKSQHPAVELHVDRSMAARAHPDRLERVVGHLVQNAIDATGPEGRVWVRVGEQGSRALIEVGDTGHGMTPEFMRERLFKPFQTTKPTGMGIGAYESHQYVHELGGEILVESEPGTGTRISLLLPPFEAESAEPAHRTAA